VVLHRGEPAVIGFKNDAGFGYALHRYSTIRAPGGGNPSDMEGAVSLAPLTNAVARSVVWRSTAGFHHGSW
jgi:hypothetical protein